MRLQTRCISWLVLWLTCLRRGELTPAPPLLKIMCAILVLAPGAFGQVGYQVISTLHAAQQPADDGQAPGPCPRLIGVFIRGELMGVFMRLVVIARLDLYHRHREDGVMPVADDEIERGTSQVHTILPEVAP